MLERIDLVLVTQSTTVIRTKYELHSYVLSLLTSSNYLGRRKKLSPINDSLSADCALSGLCFPFNICPVMPNMHPSSTDNNNM